MCNIFTIKRRVWGVCCWWHRNKITSGFCLITHFSISIKEKKTCSHIFVSYSRYVFSWCLHIFAAREHPTSLTPNFTSWTAQLIQHPQCHSCTVFQFIYIQLWLDTSDWRLYVYDDAWPLPGGQTDMLDAYFWQSISTW